MEYGTYINSSAGIVGVTIQTVTQWEEVLGEYRKVAQEGLQSQAMLVKDTAYKLLSVEGGDPKWRTKEGKQEKKYKSAPPNAPPFWHTGDFRKDLDLTLVQDGDDEWFMVGMKSPEMQQRAAWFEFGGRPLKDESPITGKPEKGKPRNRQYYLHPFLGPALEANVNMMAGRVAGIDSLN